MARAGPQAPARALQVSADGGVSESRARRFERLATAAGALVMAIGAVVLLGWFLDVSLLKSVSPTWVSMRANTALCFVLSGASFFLLRAYPEACRQRLAGQVAGLLVLLVAATTLGEYAFGWDAHLDELLFSDSAAEVAGGHPGRMGANTAVAFVFVVLALLLIDVEIRQVRPSQLAALLVGAIGLVALVGYLYGAHGFKSGFGHSDVTPMAVHTSVAFILLAHAVLLARPRVGLMALVSSERMGGFLLRRLLLPSLAVPLVLGWLRIQGESLGLFDFKSGVALLVTSVALFFWIELWFVARSLERAAMRLEMLVETQRAVVAAESDREIAAAATARIRRFLGVRRASLTEIDASTNEMVVLGFDSDLPAIGIGEGARAPASLLGDLEALRRGNLAVIEDLEAVPDPPPVVRAALSEGLRSSVSVPIVFEGELIGTLNLADSRPGLALPSETEHVARELTDQLAVALHQTRLRSQLERHAEELEARVRERTAEVEAARRELRDYVDSLTTFTGKIALDGSILLVGRVAEIASGLTHDELMAANFLEGQWWAFDASVQARVKAAFARATSGEAISYEERLYVHGDVITIILTLAPVYDSRGRVTAVMAEGRDISLQKAAEKSLEEAQAELVRRLVELEAANQELEAFSYSVSHDLRAPLRAIDGFARILSEEHADGLTDAASRYLRLVRENTTRMGELIEGLLGLSRIGRDVLRVEQIDSSELVAEAWSEVCIEAGDTAVELEIADLPWCEGDRRLVRQVFRNLLANALKFTAGRCPAVISVGATTDGDPGATPAFFVRDNGVGFDMRYADKLFGPFQRLHRQEDFAGTGIGLATVNRIVRRHGGRAWAESAPEEGATFYFTLAGSTE